MAEEPLVETVVIGGNKYPAMAQVGSGGGVAAPAPAGIAFTDASITASGASQVAAAANAARQALNITNIGTVSWWLNESGGAASVNGTGCFELPPGARWAPRPAPVNAVNGICATVGSKLTVAVG